MVAPHDQPMTRPTYGAVSVWATFDFPCGLVPGKLRALVNANQDGHVESILRACGRIGPHLQLVRKQRR